MKIFGYPDYVRNPLSGRPERNPKWLLERFPDWLVWFAVGWLCLMIAVHFFQHGLEIPMSNLGVIAIMLSFASWRQLLWNRTLRKFRAAEDRYEMGLQKAFAELEAQTRLQSTD